jgi:hypothetical protein
MGMKPAKARRSEPTIEARMESAVALKGEGAEGLPDPKVILKF